MKSLFMAIVLLIFCAVSPSVQAQGNSQQARQAYFSKLKALCKTSNPILIHFNRMMKHEGDLHRQLFFHHITQKQYAALTSKPHEWLTTIPPVRAISSKFAYIHPVPPSLRAANSQLIEFSSSMNQGLDELKRWVSNHDLVTLRSAFADFEIAHSSFRVAIKLAK